MQEARDLHLAANGFSIGDYEAKTFTIGIFGLALKFPNTEARKRAVPLHDLHHVLTGYGTDWIGEAEIGAWELRAGCNSFVTYFLNGSGAVIGLFLAPRRLWRAFSSGEGAADSLQRPDSLRAPSAHDCRRTSNEARNPPTIAIR